MKHLEAVFSQLSPAEQKKIEERAKKHGRSRLEYLGDLLEKDLAEQSMAIRRASLRYRFAREEDFSVKTFMQWLRIRHE